MSTVLSVCLEFSLNEGLQQSFHLIRAQTTLEALDRLAGSPIDALVLGMQGASECRNLIPLLFEHFPANRPALVVTGTGIDVEVFQEFIDTDQLFYLSRGNLTISQLTSLIFAGVRHRERRAISADVSEISREAGEADQFKAQLLRQADLASARRLFQEFAQKVLRSDHTRVLTYHAADNTIRWTTAPGEERVESAVAGLAAYVARTGEALALDGASEDPRYDREADYTDGHEVVSFLAQPILGSDGVVTGVVTVSRDKGGPGPFSGKDLERLRGLCAAAATKLNALIWEQEVEEEILNRMRQLIDARQLFREEALDHTLRGSEYGGGVLRSQPGWLRFGYWAVIILSVLCALALGFIRLDDRAAGPAVIRAKSRTLATANEAGIVRSIEVGNGDHVKAGQVLGRVESQDRKDSADSGLTSLESPADGTLLQISIRLGQRLSQGDFVASIIDETAGYEVFALFPGGYMSRIRPGAPMELTLAGYPGSHVILSADHVSAVGSGAGETLRYIEAPNMRAMTEPTVIVQCAALPGGFSALGRLHPYEDGMTGEAQVSIGFEPLYRSVFPAVRRISEH